MVRRSVIGILLVCVLSSFALAQQAPVFVQPGSAGYTSSQLTALQDAIKKLQIRLGDIDFGSQMLLGDGGWTWQQFAAYTAGSLQRMGYQASIVSKQLPDGTTKIWVAVGVDVGGVIAWIPVDPLPNPDARQNDLGDVPLVATLVYDSSYLSYDAVVELPPNIAPIAVIRSPLVDVVETERSAWFGNGSSDPDGQIVLYQWTFGDDVQRITHTISAWFAFDVGGMTYPISLTVTDSRGAQATASTTQYVLTQAEKEAKSCGCGSH